MVVPSLSWQNTTVFHENPSWCGYASYSLLQYRIDRMAAASVIAHTTVGPPASKNAFLRHFIHKNDDFTKTGLGQT